MPVLRGKKIMSEFDIRELIKKAEAQYRIFGKPSNQTTQEMLEALKYIRDN